MTTKTPEKKEIEGFAGFDPKTVSEDVLKMMKLSFDTTFDNMVKIQDLNDKILKDMLKKSSEVQTDAVKMVNDFIENAKKGRDEYRKIIEDGYKSVSEILKVQR